MWSYNTKKHVAGEDGMIDRKNVWWAILDIKKNAIAVDGNGRAYLFRRKKDAEDLTILLYENDFKLTKIHIKEWCPAEDAK